jgi:ABC-2 type transport system ATP-binding protein
MALTEVAVCISSLYKQFRDIQAVRGLDLEVYQGEVFGLLGPNGAGKTTTIKILLGLTRPSAGRVEVLGFDPVKQAGEVRARTGYAMQQIALDLYLTGRENLQIFAELFGLPVKAGGKRIDDLLKWAGLTEAAYRLVRTYSGGMKRRLNLALSLLHRPELFLLDEPTLGLDIHSRRQLWQLITEVKASGTTIILTTHYLEEANQLCDRVGIMDNGRLVGLGPPHQLKKDLVEDLYRLTITFGDPPKLDGLDLPLSAHFKGTDVIFSGPQTQLWQVLSLFEDHFANDIKEISYSQPTLDDVVLRLTQSQSVAREERGKE